MTAIFMSIQHLKKTWIVFFYLLPMVTVLCGSGMKRTFHVNFKTTQRVLHWNHIITIIWKLDEGKFICIYIWVRNGNIVVIAWKKIFSISKVVKFFLLWIIIELQFCNNIIQYTIHWKYNKIIIWMTIEDEWMNVSIFYRSL